MVLEIKRVFSRFYIISVIPGTRDTHLGSATSRTPTRHWGVNRLVCEIKGPHFGF